MKVIKYLVEVTVPERMVSDELIEELQMGLEDATMNVIPLLEEDEVAGGAAMYIETEEAE